MPYPPLPTDFTSFTYTHFYLNNQKRFIALQINIPGPYKYRNNPKHTGILVNVNANFQYSDLLI